MSAEPKPVRKDDETSLDYGLRVAAWKRRERARKRREREQVQAPSDSAEAAEPEEEESMRDTVENAWNKSKEYMDKEGI
jgi:hypothetical protein